MTPENRQAQKPARARRGSALARATAALMLASLGFGAKCDGLDDNNFALEESGCQSGQAQVAPQMSGMQNLCGCAETPGVTSSGTAFTCTVNAGTMVFFHFHSVFRKSRIRSVGSPSFVSSGWYDPGDVSPTSSHAVKFDAAGTYEFEDEGFTPVFGQIVVL